MDCSGLCHRGTSGEHSVARLTFWWRGDVPRPFQNPGCRETEARHSGEGRLANRRPSAQFQGRDGTSRPANAALSSRGQGQKAAVREGPGARRPAGTVRARWRPGCPLLTEACRAARAAPGRRGTPAGEEARRCHGAPSLAARNPGQGAQTRPPEGPREWKGGAPRAGCVVTGGGARSRRCPVAHTTRVFRVPVTRQSCAGGAETALFC